MATAITIHGGTGADAINYAFTVTGTNTTAHAQQFANAVNALIVPGTGEQPTFLTPGSTPGLVPGAIPPVFVLDPAGMSNATFIVPGSGYVIDTIGGGSTVDIAGNDTVLAEGSNIAADVVATGGNNEVIFVDGNNTYDGSKDSVGNDTVVAGSGFDTITTGTGSTTVYSGTGQSIITLNDTGTSGVNDIAYLNDGQSTVYANGVNDQVWANVSHETIISNASTGTLSVVLNSFGSDGGNLVSVNGGATTTVFNNTGNDTIDAGTGSLSVYDAAGTVTYVNTGSGNTVVFGAANTVVVLGSQGSGGTATYIASGGNETLSGGLATANLTLFGATVAGSSNDMTGGSGNDTLIAGAGSDTLDGGAGSNEFLLDSTQTDGAKITIGDFWASSSDTLALKGFTAQDVNNILNHGTEQNGAYVVTLSNGGTLTFEGITSGSQLSGHIVSF